MQPRRFRSLSLALNTTSCCCLKFRNCITHHGLLLQDVLVGEVHDLLIGYRNNLGQLRLESSSPFHELRFAHGIDICFERFEVLLMHYPPQSNLKRFANISTARPRALVVAVTNNEFVLAPSGIITILQRNLALWRRRPPTNGIRRATTLEQRMWH